jgi:hypothetical protein
MADGWSEFMPGPSSETPYKGIRTVVIGTHHEFQRPQDTSADRGRVRADFEKLLRRIIEEREIRLVAEEASAGGA